MTISLSTAERSNLNNHHISFGRKVSVVKKTAVSGVFILILSLITILCASLCLTLPDINVFKTVILPGVLPGSVGILTSIPLLVVGVKNSISASAIRKAWLKEIQEIIQSSGIEDFQEEERKITFIKELLPKESKDYKEKLLSEIKGFYPKKASQRTPKQEAMVEVIDKIISSFYPQKPQEKSREETNSQ